MKAEWSLSSLNRLIEFSCTRLIRKMDKLFVDNCISIDETDLFDVPLDGLFHWDYRSIISFKVTSVHPTFVTLAVRRKELWINLKQFFQSRTDVQPFLKCLNQVYVSYDVKPSLPNARFFCTKQNLCFVLPTNTSSHTLGCTSVRS